MSTPLFLKIPDSGWLDIIDGNTLWGSRHISVDQTDKFLKNDPRTHIIWLKHYGDPRLDPVKKIYDGSVLDCIPKKWIKLINQKRIHIIIDTMEEGWGPVYPDAVNYTECLDIHLLLEKNAHALGIDPTQVTWLTGDMNAQAHCIESKINVKSVCYFIWSYPNIITNTTYGKEYFENFQTQITSCFVSPNRFPKEHRAYVVANLQNVAGFRFSLPKELYGSTVLDATRRLQERQADYADHFDTKKIISWENLEAKLNLLYSKLPANIDDVDVQTNSCAQIDAISSLMPHYKKSAFSLVTETWAEGKKLFLSDAVFGSILYKTPFFLIGNCGSLAFLKSKGFKTFSTIFDERYDNIQDDIERWEMVIKQVKKISRLPEKKWIAMHNQVNNILEFNFNHMFSLALKEEQEFYDYLKRL